LFLFGQLDFFLQRIRSGSIGFNRPSSRPLTAPHFVKSIGAALNANLTPVRGA
jgi:hypothetical protein